jgi:hypothetical protein
MQEFVEALQQALPEIPAQEVTNRFRFSMGALLHVFSGNFDLDSIPDHPAQVSGDEALTSQLVAYLAAGLRAPATNAEEANAPELRMASR